MDATLARHAFCILLYLCSHAEAQRVRLVQGSTVSEMEGRVEVFHNGVWGTVCDDGLESSNTSSDVICRQLGYRSGMFIPNTPSLFGRGSGRIFLDQLSCKGSELTLDNCSHSGWGQHNCGHDEDAGVRCFGKQEVSVRLQDATVIPSDSAKFASTVQGRVEVLYNGVWGDICADSWDEKDAKTVCRILGLGGSIIEAVTIEHVTSSLLWLTDVECFGTERSLAECRHRGWGNTASCSRGTVAGVKFTVASRFTTTPYSTKTPIVNASTAKHVASTHSETKINSTSQGSSNSVMLPAVYVFVAGSAAVLFFILAVMFGFCYAKLKRRSGVLPMTPVKMEHKKIGFIKQNSFDSTSNLLNASKISIVTDISKQLEDASINDNSEWPRGVQIRAKLPQQQQEMPQGTLATKPHSLQEAISMSNLSVQSGTMKPIGIASASPRNTLQRTSDNDTSDHHVINEATLRYSQDVQLRRPNASPGLRATLIREPNAPPKDNPFQTYSNLVELGLQETHSNDSLSRDKQNELVYSYAVPAEVKSQLPQIASLPRRQDTVDSKGYLQFRPGHASYLEIMEQPPQSASPISFTDTFISDSFDDDDDFGYEPCPDGQRDYPLHNPVQYVNSGFVSDTAV